MGGRKIKINSYKANSLMGLSSPRLFGRVRDEKLVLQISSSSKKRGLERGVKLTLGGSNNITVNDPGRSAVPEFLGKHCIACFWPFGSADRIYRPPRTSL
jgi:hypothetical protein